MLTLTAQPERWQAAYLPTIYKWTSDLLNAPETSVISFIGAAFSANTTPDELQLVVFTPMTLIKGDTVKITGNQGGLYEGLFKVKRVINSTNYILEGVVVGNDTDGAAIKFPVNLIVKAKIFIGGTFVGTQEITADASNVFVLDVSRFAQAFLSADLITTATNITATNAAKDVLILYTEQYDAPDVNGDLQTVTGPENATPTRTVINAVVPYVWRYFDRETTTGVPTGSANYNLYDYILVSDGAGGVTGLRRALTRRPRTLHTSIAPQRPFMATVRGDDHEQLTFILSLTKDKYYLLFTYYDSDNQVITEKKVLPINITVANVHHFNVSPTRAQGQVTGPQWAQTVAYDVSLYWTKPAGTPTIDDIQVSLPYRYVLDTKCSRSRVRFLFLNSLGGVDAWNATGKTEKVQEIKKEFFKRNLSFPRVIGERQTIVRQSEQEFTYQVNTGKVDKFTAEWLSELVASPEVWIEEDSALINTAGSEVTQRLRLPVFILPETYTINKSQDNTFDITFQYQYAYDELVQRG